MTMAVFSAVKDGLQLEMKDHATGEPLVCAGASAIVWALAGWLRNNSGAEDLVLHLRAGDAFVQCPRTREAVVAFEMAAVGLRQIEKAFPGYIHVEVRA